MDLFSVAIGFVVGVAVSIFAPKVWGKIHAFGSGLANRNDDRP